MENTYLLSFSASRQYIFKASTTHEAMDRVARIENQLNDWLKSLFPGQTFAYYTKPELKEIPAAEVADYDGYAPLDDKAVREIEEELKREITVRRDTRELNSDAPQNDVTPD